MPNAQCPMRIRPNAEAETKWLRHSAFLSYMLAPQVLNQRRPGTREFVSLSPGTRCLDCLDHGMVSPSARWTCRRLDRQM